MLLTRGAFSFHREDESIKFRTASAILDNRFKLVESRDIQERIKALKAGLEQQK